MPGPGPSKNALLEEMRRGRNAFYQSMAREALDSANRLDQAYRVQLKDIERSIREFEQSDSWDAQAQIRQLNNLKEIVQGDLTGLQGAIVDVGARAQRTGVESGYRSALAALNRGRMTATFNQPSLATIQAGINYVDSPAWRAAVGRLGQYHADTIADHVLAAIGQGTNPRQTAEWLRGYFVTSQRPLIDALRMARTTQLYAARTGSSATYQKHGVEFWLWAANLGNPRTCIGCIVMHGTKHPSTEILRDHHLGRCGPIPVTPTWAELGFDSGGDVVVETGIDWFKKQPADLQSQMMGPGMFQAWQAGAFKLESIPRYYQNDIFGPMIRPSSLRDLLSGNGGDVLGPSGGPLGQPIPGGRGPSGGDDWTAIEVGYSVPPEVVEANRASYERARAVTPDRLMEGITGDTQADYLYTCFAFSDEGAPIYSREAFHSAKVDYLYETYTAGRGIIPQDYLFERREKAGALLSVDDWLGGVLDRRERKALESLASTDDSTVIAGIDSIRDRRLRGVLTTGTTQAQERNRRRGNKYDPLFVSAATEDAINILNEVRRGPSRGYYG